ncbi:hypothetical protein [Elizabethkingia meningoseptica]|uniref:hypothetical protein n=1 Tax=Elizabethkingia meningoseptica TaxID=238 RepID=UPI003891E314
MQSSKYHTIALVLGIISLFNLALSGLAYFSIISIIIIFLCLPIAFLTIIPAVILDRKNKLWWITFLIVTVSLICFIIAMSKFTLHF